MKQFAVLFTSLVLAVLITGCGGSTPAAARLEDMPDEVKEYEARREAERSSGKGSLPSRPLVLRKSEAPPLLVSLAENDDRAMAPRQDPGAAGAGGLVRHQKVRIRKIVVASDKLFSRGHR